MCGIPTDILDEEIVARAVKTPHHFDRRKRALTSAAFRPAPETDDVSVMRSEHMGVHACKEKAKDIAGAAYIGLAAIGATEIRREGAVVVDSRQGHFCGHAHISYGKLAPPKGVTASPQLIARYKALAKAARLYIDLDPMVAEWTGPALA